MALQNLGDIITQALVRNGRSTSIVGITDAVINGWTQSAHTWAASYHKWPFTEGRVSTTYARVEEWGFEGYKADSIRLILIGGYSVKKIGFEEYLKFRETEPTADDRIFSSYGRTVFINPSIDLSGTLTAYGQYQPANLDVTDLTASTVFSGYDDEGNEAIVEKITSYIKDKDKDQKGATLHDQKASLKLDEVWKRVLDEQYKKQVGPSSEGMFKRVDVVNGGFTENINNTDQF